jgi:phage/plasmid-like protein (TIGR03299 family)
MEMHNVETMAYAGETPWHGLGVKVPGDLTPAQMLEAAKLDWEVELVPNYATYKKKKVATGTSSLFRSSDSRLLSARCSDDWKPVQNQVVAEFFNDFCAAGDMTIETAGSLAQGEIVWMLAKMKESFDLFKGKDQIDAYCLLSNFHRYGFSTSVSLTPIRVVCQNTLNLSLSTTKGDKIVRVNHRNDFNSDDVKETLGMSAQKMKQYKEAATFLSKKKMKKEDIVTYFKRIFPVITSKVDGSKKELSKPAADAMKVLDTQPGAELGAGTFWSAYNASTYYLDHLAGRSADTRLTSAWYGEARKKKVLALTTAVEMAEAA